jgi:hypothetical protein
MAFSDNWWIVGSAVWRYNFWRQADRPVYFDVSVKSKRSEREETLTVELTLEQAKNILDRLTSVVCEVELNRLNEAKKEARKWTERALWSEANNDAQAAVSCRK